MPKIKVLDRLVANQIAAGEVIERPASAIKEVLENAIDAGADQITIEVGNGGRDLRINDNGCGMEPEDLLLAFERFATSKIDHIDDLNRLHTMGFRGEALASIASVAKVECISRTRDQKLATRLLIEGGEVISVTEVAANPGTTLSIRELFYNIPARLKFLKSPQTEFSHVYQVVFNLALTHPDKSIKLLHNGREMLDTAGITTLGEVASLLMGKETANGLIPLEYQFPGGKITGLISAPDEAKPTKSSQYFFLNHRWIKSPLLQKALMEGYEAALPKDRYPVAILEFAIDPAQFDVNVHPTKQEVRFINPQAIFRALREAVKKSLSVSPLSKKLEGFGAIKGTEFLPPEEGFSGKATAQQPFRNFQLEAPARQASLNIGPSAIPSYFYSPPAEVVAEKPEIGAYRQAEKKVLRELGTCLNLKILGTLQDTYILADDGENLLVIDFHVAHERVIFDKLKQESHPVPYPLLVPQQVEFTPREEALCEENGSLIQSFGFTLEPFGLRTYLIRSTPAVVQPAQAAEALHQMLQDLSEGGEKATLEEKRNTILESVACKAAVKAGQKLSLPEMEKLLKDLFATNQPHTCPHGRPIIVEFPVKELAKRFKRG